jgi:ribonuclease HI
LRWARSRFPCRGILLGIMPSFLCRVCGAPFEIAQVTIDKYAGWQPKYCREHRPNKTMDAQQQTRGPAQGGSVRGASLREENLTLAEVLAKYRDGPGSGVFTDGSAVPNPGPGGWGAVWVEDHRIRSERHGHDPDTTNNRMELTALIEAFKMLPGDVATDVHTDSRLCVDTITKWAPGWERKGWKRKTGPIKNLELVQELLALYRAHPKCRLVWIAAHSGQRWNEYADSLATAWMRSET